MANSIFKNRELVLRCSNSLIDLLHQNLRYVAKGQQVTKQNILDLIEALDQDQIGRGFIDVDLTRFLITPEDQLIFFKLTQLAIDKAVKDGQITSEIEQRVREFQNKIIDNG